MYTTSDFRRNLAILFQGEPYEITEFQHHKPGKGASIVRTKLRNLKTGNNIDVTFRSGDKVERPDLEQREVEYLYQTEDIYHFMDQANFEQFEVSAKLIADRSNFMMENMKVQLLFFKGEPISIELPNHIVLQIVQCDPATRGDTVSGATKPAKVTTGYVCQVPLFVNEGDKIRIDTRTGEYIERAA